METSTDQVRWLSADEMNDAADEIWALAERVISPSTQRLLRQAASSLRWQARWERQHPPVREPDHHSSVDG